MPPKKKKGKRKTTPQNPAPNTQAAGAMSDAVDIVEKTGIIDDIDYIKDSICDLMERFKSNLDLIKNNMGELMKIIHSDDVSEKEKEHYQKILTYYSELYKQFGQTGGNLQMLEVNDIPDLREKLVSLENEYRDLQERYKTSDERVEQVKEGLKCAHQMKVKALQKEHKGKFQLVADKHAEEKEALEQEIKRLQTENEEDRKAFIANIASFTQWTEEDQEKQQALKRCLESSRWSLATSMQTNQSLLDNIKRLKIENQLLKQFLLEKCRISFNERQHLQGCIKKIQNKEMTESEVLEAMQDFKVDVDHQDDLPESVVLLKARITDFQVNNCLLVSQLSDALATFANETDLDCENMMLDAENNRLRQILYEHGIDLETGQKFANPPQGVMHKSSSMPNLHCAHLIWNNSDLNS